MENKAKLIVSKAKTRTEALRLLQREGFRADEADRVVTRFFKIQRRRSFNRADKVSPPNSSPRKAQAPLTPRDQHVDLIAFSNNVSVDKASQPLQPEGY